MNLTSACISEGTERRDYRANVDVVCMCLEIVLCENDCCSGWKGHVPVVGKG